LRFLLVLFILAGNKLSQANTAKKAKNNKNKRKGEKRKPAGQSWAARWHGVAVPPRHGRASPFSSSSSRPALSSI